MLKVGSKFYTFDELSRRLEEFQELEQVQLWVRDSRTVVAAAKRARRKSLNPALKYAELTYSCVFGGRRPSDQTKIHNQTSAGGCPFKVRLSTSNDGQALVVKEICHEHNHEPGKKLHEEPRRLYKKTQSRTTVRKPVRYIVNKQRVTSNSSKTKSRSDHSESHVQLGQSPFHHLHLHQQQYQQQQQLKLQLQQHLQQQQEQQQQTKQRQVEVIQLDSPDHIDTPDHLSSPDLSTSFDQLGSLNNSVDQYMYLPPSPISPSLSSGCPVDCEEDERLEPILDLEEALEEALGDLDSVGSMDVDTSLRLTSTGSTTPAGDSPQAEVTADDYTGPPPAKRQRGRPRKQSFTGSMAPSKNEKAKKEKVGESSKQEEDFLGFSPSGDKGKPDTLISRADIVHANSMARQLHVYKPGIDFVPGARLEVLESRDNNWYQCKIVEVDWGELDILVHYERWSNRFDEWLKMDSTRIRPLVRSSNRKERRSTLQFCVGERVTARWPADGKRYQAKVTRILPEDQYEVLFFDGMTKVVRATAMTKLESKMSGCDDLDESLLHSPPGTSASSAESRGSSPEPDTHITSVKGEHMEEMTATTPIKKSIFDVEIIEQKRKPKRKAAVEELFRSLKKKRKYEYHGSGRKVESVLSSRFPRSASSSSSSQRMQVRPQSHVRKGPGSKSSQVRESSASVPSADDDTAARYPPTAEASDTIPLPQSSNFVVIEMEGGWKKCCTRRTHGNSVGKWDIHYITPDKKKMRSKSDLHRYKEEFGLSLDTDKFDFSTKNIKGVIESQKQDWDAKDTAKTQTAKVHRDAEQDEGTGENKEEKDDTEVDKPESTDDKGPTKTSTSSTASSSLSIKIPLVKPTVSKTAAAKKPDSKQTKPDVKPDVKQQQQMKPDVKQVKPDVKPRPTEAKSTDSPRMKIEIPIIPKAETRGMSPAAASPWSPTTTLPSALTPLLLPASAPVTHTEHTAEDGGVKQEQEQHPSRDTPSSMATEVSLPSPRLAETLTMRHKQAIKKETTHQHETDEPVKQEQPSGKDTATPQAAQETSTTGTTPKLTPTPSRQKHILKKEPIRDKHGHVAPNEFVVRAEHNEHTCPKQGCGKGFRKENLLQMHIKHYHPEILKKGTSIAPNVADLAYARTVGDHLELSASPPSCGPSSSPVTERTPRADPTLTTKKAVRPSVLTSAEKIKSGEKAKGTIKTLGGTSKDARKKDALKYDPDLGSDDEMEVKDDLDDYIDDLEDEASPAGMGIDDPDYMPTESELTQLRRDRRERRRTRHDLKHKKRKLEYVSSEATTQASQVKKIHPSEEPLVAVDVEEENTADTWVEGSEGTALPETSSEIINCGCGSTEEEGLMLQCDVCQCWQHGACYNIVREDQVPDKYICSLCDHPRLERSSHKFRHHQDWLKEGRLPRFSFSTSRGDVRLESCVRRGHELTANVLQLSHVLHSLRLKLHISKEADHPKFVMWHRKWDEKEEEENLELSDPSLPPTNTTMAPLHDFMNIVEQQQQGPPPIHPPSQQHTDSLLLQPAGMDSSCAIPDPRETVARHSIPKRDTEHKYTDIYEGRKQQPCADAFKPSKSMCSKSDEIAMMNVDGDSATQATTTNMNDTADEPEYETKPIVQEEVVLPENKGNNPTQQSVSMEDSTERQSDTKKDSGGAADSEDRPQSEEGQDVEESESKDICDQLIAKPSEGLHNITTGTVETKTEDTEDIKIIFDSPKSESEEGKVDEPPTLETNPPRVQPASQTHEETQPGLFDLKSEDTEHPEDCKCEDQDMNTPTSADSKEVIQAPGEETASSTHQPEAEATDRKEDVGRLTDQPEPHDDNDDDDGVSELATVTDVTNIDDTSDTTHDDNQSTVNTKLKERRSKNVAGVTSVNELLVDSLTDKENNTKIEVEELKPEDLQPSEETHKQSSHQTEDIEIKQEEKIEIKQEDTEVKDEPAENPQSTTPHQTETPGVKKEDAEMPEGADHQTENKTGELEESHWGMSESGAQEMTVTQGELQGVEIVQSREKKAVAEMDTKETGCVGSITQESQRLMETQGMQGDKDMYTQSNCSQEKQQDPEGQSSDSKTDDIGKDSKTAAAATTTGQTEMMDYAEDDNAHTHSNNTKETQEVKDPNTRRDDIDKEAQTVPSMGQPLEDPVAMDTAEDDVNTQLDDTDDLTLDLGGGEGGSELAVLLSSHSELEQLVTQASSTLAPHVPSQPIQQVSAPIIPEAERIEPVNCKLNLLDHVQVMQNNITRRFDEIEKQLEVLEAEMGLGGEADDDNAEDDTEDRHPATLQARALIKLILNDVSVVRKVAEFAN